VSALGLCCRDFVELATGYSERLLPDERREEFEEHLLVCPACAEYAEQLRRITLLLPRLGDRAAQSDEGRAPAGDEEPAAPVRALKFLGPDRRTPFGRDAWPEPGTWIADVYACSSTEQVPYWLNDELWLAELDVVTDTTERSTAARRGRLVEQVAAWNEQARTAFGERCVAAVRDATAAVLERHGLADAAAALAARDVDAALMSDAAEQAANDALDLDLRAAWDYLGTAIEFAERPPSVAFIAAVAAEHAHGEDGAHQERARQAGWLRDELALPDLP
jgi:hypothetical protein